MLTIDELERRVVGLEQELIRLRADLSAGTSPSREVESRGARLMREAEPGRTQLVVASDRMKKELGIQGPSIGAKKLREMLIADG